MELLVLVDNNTYIDVDAAGEPGASFVLDDGEQRILFDMGITDIFLKNAAFFGVDLSKVTKAAFSHGHYDHMRGLIHWIEQPYAGRIPIVAHPDCFIFRSEGERDIGSPMSAQQLRAHCPLTLSREPVQLSRNIVFLGEIPRVTDFEEGGLNGDPLPHRKGAGACHGLLAQRHLQHHRAGKGGVRRQPHCGGHRRLSPAFPLAAA